MSQSLSSPTSSPTASPTASSASSSSSSRLKSQNPFTGEVLETFATISDADLDTVLAQAETAARRARQVPLSQRQTRLRALAERMTQQRDELAGVAVREMGKTLVAARSEVEKCALTARWYADHLPTLAADTQIQEKPYHQFVRHLPLGAVLAIMPWNFPYWQAFRAAIPALSAGNVMVLKHASNVSRCALWIERLFSEAGFAPHDFQTVLLESARVARVIADPRIRGVTLTGSESAGRAVASEAGRHLKKCVLELGGSDPFVVMPSADIDFAAKSAAQSRTINNGQSCISAKRFIVHDAVFDRFLTAFEGYLRGLRVGDPMSLSTDVGPLVHAQALQTLLQQCERARQAGAEARLEPQLERAQNLFYPSLLIAPENATAEIFQEEMFGPVALVFRAHSLEHALDIANQSRFGLGSSIWTTDSNEIRQAIQTLEAGMTFVNRIVASEPQLPFGGTKASGYGRELGMKGFHEFTNAKSVSYGTEIAGD
ncbi:MAG: aldehyde dehydrogenase family protein [Bdellovibrionaceae bacterium]|nr:aldehyde dehydrogenase family protein [Pseudobdellovibrionaceae bacterium]